MGQSSEPLEPRAGPLLRFVADQRVAFLIVGSINTALGFALFVVFDLTIGRALDRSAGTIVGSLVTLLCAHVLSVVCAFILHRRFVFRVQGNVLRDFARFESVYLLAITINAVVLPLAVEVGMNRILAQGIITVATTVLSYLGHRYFSFRRRAA